MALAWRSVAVPIVVAALASQPSGQSFSSGSNGSDGALSMGTPGNYDLSLLGKDPDHDHVYHFTTINIGGGVELDALGPAFDAPVVFLAQGDVLIQGTIWMRGENGHDRTAAQRGGAILIASSTLINILGGRIVAAGGAGPPGGAAGVGGTIRLVAPVIQGDGTLDVRGGSFEGGTAATSGRIRLEAFQHAHQSFSYPGLDPAKDVSEGTPSPLDIRQPDPPR